MLWCKGATHLDQLARDALQLMLRQLTGVAAHTCTCGSTPVDC